VCAESKIPHLSHIFFIPKISTDAYPAIVVPFSKLMIILILLVAIRIQLKAQQIGDTVVMQSTTSTNGVPVHPAAGDNHYVRWTNGTYAVVTAIDTSTGWRELLNRAGATGWVVPSYLTVIKKPVLSQPKIVPGSGFQLTISSATSNRPFVIESSDDGVSWAPISTNTFSSSTNMVLEDLSEIKDRLFYRAVAW
jgi:hypothetical protein